MKPLPAWPPAQPAWRCRSAPVPRITHVHCLASPQLPTLPASLGPAHPALPHPLLEPLPSLQIVDKNCDLDKAVEAAHFACYFNMGQCCAAGTRTYVHESIYDEFVAKAGERAKNRKVCDPFADGELRGS